MRLSRSMSVEAALACGLVLTALALAAPNSVAEASSVAPVSRYLTFHHTRRSLLTPANLLLSRAKFVGRPRGSDPRLGLRLVCAPQTASVQSSV